MNYDIFVVSVLSLSLGSEKQEEIGKEEWMNRLGETQVTRADMNKLVMNYLVTGNTQPRAWLFKTNDLVS